mmetsp:Transcript_82080/g.255081  ORF Transcript_82080/g.255081 Transcript_82080/m.255081 type:complete len:262 (-) Transcript_82080:723-1508(-)
MGPEQWLCWLLLLRLRRSQRALRRVRQGPAGATCEGDAQCGEARLHRRALPKLHGAHVLPLRCSRPAERRERPAPLLLGARRVRGLRGVQQLLQGRVPLRNGRGRPGRLDREHAGFHHWHLERPFHGGGDGCRRRGRFHMCGACRRHKSGGILPSDEPLPAALPLGQAVRLIRAHPGRWLGGCGRQEVAHRRSWGEVLRHLALQGHLHLGRKKDDQLGIAGRRGCRGSLGRGTLAQIFHRWLLEAVERAGDATLRRGARCG